MDKFKPGDKVKVIKGSSTCLSNGCCSRFIGKIGTIMKYQNSGISYAVNNFEDETEWCSGFSEDCLELVIQDWDE